ncbi:MAG: DUF971 domain-containing protein [Deltaproteobacteria bacterium]|nr:DUF971 domain-containing protein [Deltaproteobacteria bacterium]
MSKIRPVEVRHDRENGRVVVSWDDGTRQQYPLDDLRNACPCAGCRGHSPGEVEPPSVQGAVLMNIAEVGTYALRFDWGDGHTTGIYAWGYLKEIGQEMLA